MIREFDDVLAESYGVFSVAQITRGTPLESIVAADWVTIERGQISEVHRHNEAETVLLFLEGSGFVRVGESEIAVRAGQRLSIGRGVYHGVRTEGESLAFLSVQAPPILDKATGRLDLETLPQGSR